jgi:hypothetical protein
MTTPQAIVLIRNIIGEPKIVNGMYDSEYVLSAFLLASFVVGLFVLIVNFQKAMTRGRGRF